MQGADCGPEADKVAWVQLGASWEFFLVDEEPDFVDDEEVVMHVYEEII